MLGSETLPNRMVSKEKQKEAEEKAKNTNRYLIQVELLSATRYKENNDDNGKRKEYYFEVGNRFERNRTPTSGYIKMGPKDDEVYPTSLTLYSRFIDGEEGNVLEIPMWVKEANDELMKWDDTIAFKKLKLALGGAEDVHTIKEAGTVLKISVEASKTNL